MRGAMGDAGISEECGGAVLDERLVNAIYDGPMEESPWQSLLATLRRITGADLAALSLRLRRTNCRPISLLDSAEPFDVQRYQASSLEVAHKGYLDPLGSHLRRTGGIATLDEVIDEKMLRQSDYFRLLLEPFGLRHQIGMHVREPSGWRSNFGLMNRSGRPFGASERALLARMLPHLQRALGIYARLSRSEAENAALGATLDRLSIGTILLDLRGKVVSVSDTATAIMRRNGCLGIVRETLSAKRPADSFQLNGAIAQALIANEEGQAAFCDAIRLHARDGNDVRLLIRNVPSASYRGDVSPGVILYLSDPLPHMVAAQRFMAQMFDLTETEAEIATAIANGERLAAIAETLGFTEGTVRTYSKRIYLKMGVSRQAELMRLVLKSVALLA